MKLTFRHALLALLLLGAIFVFRGATLWAETDTGVQIQNWITPATVVPPHAFRWTWGVGGNPSNEPESWHFKAIFDANDTANVLLLWNLNQSVLYERSTSHVDDTLTIPLPRADEAWRWDWIIENPHDGALNVLNFTIIHYPLRYPERMNGSIAMGVGVAIMILGVALFVRIKPAGIRRKRRG